MPPYIVPVDAQDPEPLPIHSHVAVNRAEDLEGIMPGDFSDDSEDDELDFDDDDDLLVDYLNAAEEEDPPQLLSGSACESPCSYPFISIVDPKLASADICTVDEAKALRRRLRVIGPSEFVRETITSERYTARKLITAFGIRPPPFYEGRPDEGYYRLLGILITRECATRKKLPQYNTVDDAATLLRERKNIVVITGAGISTNLGVPDFRSTKTGFYAKMREEHGFERPEEIFDIERFEEDPSIFFRYSAETLPAPGKSTPTHAFIKLLDTREQLLTNYTQNIDNVEGNVGIAPTKLIQCHGSWATFTCRKCGAVERGEQFYELVTRHEIPRCKYDIPEAGIMKPDITFFGEKLPDTFFDRFKLHDRDRVDLVVVIGTSMMVAPVSEIPMALAEEVPHIYISRAPVKHLEFDITLLGDCDVVTAELARRAGWDLKHPMLEGKEREVEVECVDQELAIWKMNRVGEQEEETETVIAQASSTEGVPDRSVVEHGSEVRANEVKAPEGGKDGRDSRVEVNMCAS
ncbi:hypothetical protein FH972_026503 [Carpinus fangiana]|uniref:Deacetylase sirtuin-type domain-containing protein n=1 Tax=Carpinus fangiana TaxID=176857 RepID=A0A5N6L6P8_9ROSI|nr:hypothetical protein FH972_026503 [Carpinus fangiana]